MNLNVTVAKQRCQNKDRLQYNNNNNRVKTVQALSLQTLCTANQKPFFTRTNYQSKRRMSPQETVAQAVSNKDTTTVLQSTTVAVFSSSSYVEDFMKDSLDKVFGTVTFIPNKLDIRSVEYARGSDVVCLFVNDECDREILLRLKDMGVSCVALRCAGFDRVDIDAAHELGIHVVRVPTYSPRSVAEGAMCLMLATARNLRSAVLKVAVGNYTLNGLVGMELTGKTFGIIGTGNIGIEFIKLLKGFDGTVLAYDVYPNQKAVDAGAQYVDMDTLLSQSDVVSLHVPLLPSTKNIMNKENLGKMKENSILINVSRGGLIDTHALIEMLTTGECGIRAIGMDVYENEDSLFFTDFTDQSAQQRMKSWDNKFTVLKSLPQVVVTPHTAFLTEEALENICETTIQNIVDVMDGKECVNAVLPKK
jgi:D-lactate dehydrogenase